MVTMIEQSVPGFEVIYREIGDRIREFKFIRSSSISYDEDSEFCNIEIELRNGIKGDESLVIRCINVVKYVMNFVDIGNMFVSGLQVFSRSTDNTARVKWELSDYEDGRIIILCADMNISRNIS